MTTGHPSEVIYPLPVVKHFDFLAWDEVGLEAMDWPWPRWEATA